MSSNDNAQGPLAGLKVLDFSSFIAGCYAGVLLGDMGAEVIKVEPIVGDGARYWGPFLAGEGRAFQGWNRNKRGLAIDVRKEKGREIIHKLIEQSDILIENFRPGVSAKLHLDYETTAKLNPRIIHCSVTAFGPKGPLSDRPGYDPMFQAMAGLANANASYLFAGKPCISAVAMSDYGAALLASNGIMAALYHRERTGEGQHVGTSLLQAAMALQSQYFIKATDTEEKPPFGIFPYRLFQTQDSMTFVGVATDKFWAIFCDAIERPDLSAEEKYATNAGRVSHAEELNAILEPIFLTRTSQAWEDKFIPKGLPCGSLGTHQEFFQSEQVAAMDMKTPVTHTTIGNIQLGGVPVHLSKSPGQVQSAAPLLGEHTKEILAGLGYNESEMEALSRDAVVKS